MTVSWNRLRRDVFAYIAVLVSLLFVMTAEEAVAAKYQTQNGYQGNAICGGVDLRTGKLLPPCGFVSSEKIGPAKKDCPNGSHLDIGTWTCFSCPSGFNRTGFAVDTDKACSREIAPPRFGPAQFRGNHQKCDSGSVLDPRNGGECWKCPAGYGRTAAAVNEWNACGMIFKSARSAQFIKRVCPAGSETDPNGKCYSCPDGGVRTWESASHSRACMVNEELKPAIQHGALTCKAGEDFDFIDGGSCWKCPVGSRRSVYHVKGPDACEYVDMRWEGKPRTPNGLFAIPGGAQIVADVVLNRKLIDQNINSYIEKENITDPKFANEAWQLILDNPERSIPLNAAVYSHVFNLIQNGPKTAYERDFLDYFSIYIQQSRQLSATEMKNAWDSWKRGVSIKLDMNTNRFSLSSLFNIGYAPPDMSLLVGDVMKLGPAASITATYAGITLLEGHSVAFANASASMIQKILPFTFKKAIKEGAVEVAKGLARQGASSATAGGVGVGTASATGPFVILTVYAILGTIATDMVIEQDKQESIVYDALEVAKRPVSLSRMISYDVGLNEMLGNWALMTQEPIAPNPSQWAAVKSRVSGNYKPIEGTRWTDYNDTAQDIAIGSDQALYILKDMPMPDGFPVQKLDPQTGKFVNVSSNSSMLQAVRIAVAGNILWGIDKKGRIFSYDGTRHKIINGPKASEIGAADQFVWILDDKGIPYRFNNGNGRWILETGKGTSIDVDRSGRPWVTNSANEIWTKDDQGRWTKLYGEGLQISAFEERRGVVVGSDGRVYRYNPTTNKWEQLGMKTDTRTVAMNYSQLWRINKNGKISKWE